MNESAHDTFATKSEDEPKGFASHRKQGFWRRVVIPLVIIICGLAVSGYILKTGPEPRRKSPRIKTTLVEVTALAQTREKIIIQAMGMVIPAQEIELKSRVSGEIVAVNPKFQPGGRFRTDEEMLRIDPEDYKLAEEQKQREVVDAETAYKIELGNQEIARYEWERLTSTDDNTKLGKELALREPQLTNAEAAVKAAQAALKKARLDMARTTITAPFNTLVLSTQVDIGAQVSAQSSLATLVGTDEYWVQVSLPVDRLKWITMPDEEGKRGSTGTVRYANSAAQEAQWKGRVVRCLGDLEKEGRMARLLFSVKNPLGLKTESVKSMPLLLGSYVCVDIVGLEVDTVFSIPPTAVHDGDSVWIMRDDNTLEVRKVEIVWQDKNRILVKRGLHDGDLMVTSDISTPVTGMLLTAEGLNRTSGTRTAKEETPPARRNIEAQQGKESANPPTRSNVRSDTEKSAL